MAAIGQMSLEVSWAGELCFEDHFQHCSILIRTRSGVVNVMAHINTAIPSSEVQQLFFNGNGAQDGENSQIVVCPANELNTLAIYTVVKSEEGREKELVIENEDRISTDLCYYRISHSKRPGCNFHIKVRNYPKEKE